MILVDTSIWIDHFNRGDQQLQAMLLDGLVLIHPFVAGEIALGTIRQRDIILAMLRALPRAVPMDHDEVFGFIDRHHLHGVGIGYVDVHLLGATKLSSAMLWTRDKRLRAAAEQMGIAATPRHTGD